MLAWLGVMDGGEVFGLVGVMDRGEVFGHAGVFDCVELMPMPMPPQHPQV